MRTPIIALVSCTLLPCAALANDASYYGDGATVYAAKESRVRMARERVFVRPSAPREGEPRFLARWEADCTFDLRNLTAEPVTVQVGFPDWRAFGDHPDRGWAIRDFRVEVDGKPVEAVHKEVSPPKTGDFRHEGAWTWSVSIPASGTATVRNTYRFGGFSSNGPYSACAGEKPHAAARRAFWRHAPRVEGAHDFEDGLCGVVSYVVTTAKTWSGTVGDAEISIELPAETEPHLFVPVPEATEVRDRTVTWRFRDWTPKRELSVILVHPIPPDDPEARPAFASVAQARAWTTFAKANGFDAAAVRRASDWTAKAREGRNAAETKRILEVLERFAVGR